MCFSPPDRITLNSERSYNYLDFSVILIMPSHPSNRGNVLLFSWNHAAYCKGDELFII